MKREKVPKGLETLFLSNEWEFLDSVLKEINERVNCLNKLKTSIVTNEEVAKRRLLPNRENSIEGKRALKSKRKNKKKADQRKQKRLEAHMAEVMKILTGHTYKKGDTGMVIDNEKLIELRPKMHLEAMKELLSQDCFANESADQVYIFVRSMERSNKRPQAKRKKLQNQGVIDFSLHKKKTTAPKNAAVNESSIVIDTSDSESSMSSPIYSSDNE